MGISIKNNISDNLKRLAAQNEKVYKTGLRTAAQFVAERLKQNSPYNSVTDLHLKDSVAISPIRDGEIQIGYTKDVYWRVKFVEFGTIKQPPQHFMEDTFNETQVEATLILAEELRKGLNL